MNATHVAPDSESEFEQETANIKIRNPEIKRATSFIEFFFMVPTFPERDKDPGLYRRERLRWDRETSAKAVASSGAHVLRASAEAVDAWPRVARSVRNEF